MKILIATIALMLFMPMVHAQSTTDTLTNAKVIELHKKGLSASVIVNKIKSSPCNFDVSTEALLLLKEHNIPDEITNAMIETSASKTNALTIADPHDPASPHESGIYYWSIAGAKNAMQKLEATVCTQVKYGSGVGSRLTYGIASTKMKATIDGAASRVQIKDSLPVFYFYFDQAASGNTLNTSNTWFAPSSSPNEFLLIKMDTKKTAREFVTGKSNAYTGTTFGVDDKYKVDFNFERIGAGTYKVVPKAPLKPGEYCFMYAGNVTAGGQGSKVFDFGIQ
jgi:hypothetical protein